MMTEELPEYTGFSFPRLLDQYDIDISQYTDRQKIEIMEWALLDNFDNVAQELPVDEFIHDGMYYRALTIPAGVCLTGKIHHDDHICILEQGDLSVMTDDGLKRLQAPARFKARAGLKKIGYAHSDVVFSTIHRTDITDCKEAEARHVSDSDLAWVDDLMDFKQFLVEWGLPEKLVFDLSRDESDIINDTELSDRIELKDSKIQGKGVFSRIEFIADEIIGNARIGDKRTALGRYTNHSKRPNAQMIKGEKDNLLLVAIQPISKGDEITIDYREAGKCHLQE